MVKGTDNLSSWGKIHSHSLSINNNFSILFDLLLTQMICTVSPANIFTVTNQAVYYQIDFVLKKFKSSSLH